MAKGINVLASIFPSTGFQYVNAVRATCVYHENNYPSANSSSSVLSHQIHPSQLPVYSLGTLEIGSLLIDTAAGTWLLEGVLKTEFILTCLS